MPDSCESATSMPDWSVVAAAFSAIATGFAAFAAWKSPIEAAKLAEGLRRTAELANRRHDGKMQLFATLMQERAAIYSAEGVRALNLIDVVFARMEARSGARVRSAREGYDHDRQREHVYPSQAAGRHPVPRPAAHRGDAHAARGRAPEGR